MKIDIKYLDEQIQRINQCLFNATDNARIIGVVKNEDLRFYASQQGITELVDAFKETVDLLEELIGIIRDSSLLCEQSDGSHPKSPTDLQSHQ